MVATLWHFHTFGLFLRLKICPKRWLWCFCDFYFWSHCFKRSYHVVKKVMHVLEGNSVFRTYREELNLLVSSIISAILCILLLCRCFNFFVSYCVHVDVSFFRKRLRMIEGKKWSFTTGASFILATDMCLGHCVLDVC